MGALTKKRVIILLAILVFGTILLGLVWDFTNDSREPTPTPEPPTGETETPTSTPTPTPTESGNGETSTEILTPDGEQPTPTSTPTPDYGDGGSSGGSNDGEHVTVPTPSSNASVDNNPGICCSDTTTTSSGE